MSVERKASIVSVLEDGEWSYQIVVTPGPTFHEERHATRDDAREWSIRNLDLDPFSHLPVWAVEAWVMRERELQPRLI